MGRGEYRHQGEGCRWDGQPWAPSLVFPVQQLLWGWPVSPERQDYACLSLQRQDWLPPESKFSSCSKPCFQFPSSVFTSESSAPAVLLPG